MVYKEELKINTKYVIPTDNEIFGEAMIKYPMGWKIDPFVSSSIKTQLTESFIVNKGVTTATAKLWDPVTSMQSIGFTYSYLFNKSQITSRIGVSLKQIRANRFTQLTDDFKTPLIKEKYKAEMGIEFKTEATLQVNSSIRYFTILEFFGKYNNLDKITGKWQNELQVSLWKSLSLILKIDLAYDENQRAKLQYKENLRLGMVVNF